MTDGARLIAESVVVTIALTIFGAWALYSFVIARRQSPGAVRELNQLTTELSNRVGTLEKERQRDHAEMLWIQLRVAELEIGVRVLIAQIRRMGGEPEWNVAADGPIPPVSEVIDDTALYRSIAALFDVDELDDLAFRLGIEPDDLDGKRRDTRARSLVQYCKRRDLLPELIDIARQLRPEGRF